MLVLCPWKSKRCTYLLEEVIEGMWWLVMSQMWAVRGFPPLPQLWNVHSTHHSHCQSLFRDADLEKWTVRYGWEELNWICDWSQLRRVSCPVVSDPLGPCGLSPTSLSLFQGILQARILEWITISFSKGSSQPRDWTWVYRIAGRLLPAWITREAQGSQLRPLYKF